MVQCLIWNNYHIDKDIADQIMEVYVSISVRTHWEGGQMGHVPTEIYQ